MEINTPMHLPVTAFGAVVDPLITIHGVGRVYTFYFQGLFGKMVRLNALAMDHPMNDVTSGFKDGNISVTVATP